jgi:hypothetical protein
MEGRGFGQAVFSFPAQQELRPAGHAIVKCVNSSRENICIPEGDN